MELVNRMLLSLAAVLAWQSPDVLAKRDPLIERLDPQTRARVILALAGLLLLGALLIGGTWLVFRMIRCRIRDHEQIVEKQRRRAVNQDDWAKKPLAPPAGEAVDQR
jgi:uncharacterized protein YneF (UPF0154 family)